MTAPGGPAPLSVLVAFGTRPEAIKLAPVVRRLHSSPSLRPVVAVSGQHREMLDQMTALFGIVPDHDLDVLVPGQTLAHVTAACLAGYTAILAAEPPAAVVVQGDTTTTFAAALAAFYHRIPVVHVEAGLRTLDRYAPYPEEINRRLTTQLTQLHLAPTAANRANLLAEGVPATSVRVTGNTVIDALLEITARQVPIGVPGVDEAIAEGRRLIVVTAHRRESWGAPMAQIGAALADVARAFPDVLVVLPAHRNMLVRDQLLPPLRDLPNVVVVEPMDYAPFCSLLAAATLVLTDSGGIQEEAPSLGKPVLVLRDTTERPEAVHAGTVALVGTDRATIVAKLSRLLSDQGAYRQMARAVNPYGDGRAARRAVAAIEELLGLGGAEPDFAPGDVDVPELV